MFLFLARRFELWLRRSITCTAMLMLPLSIPNSECQEQDPRQTHGSNLKSNPRNHQIIARAQQACIVVVPSRCSSRNTSTDSLHHNTQYIAADEQPWIPSRLQDRVLGPKVKNQILDRQVNTSSDEGWRENQAHDLDFERIAVPWVLGHQVAADVPGHLS